MKPIIVIPTYNEKENIIKLIPRLVALPIAKLEVIIVDDGSPDGTAAAVDELTKKYPVLLINRQAKSGLGSAYIAGFHTALARGADYIFEMDADLSHDPDDVPRLLAAGANNDLVIGSRKIPGGKIIGWGWTRQAMSAGAMGLSRAILGLRAKDVTSGFRCFRRAALERLNLDDVHSNGYAFQEELLFRAQQAGLRICEVPVTFIDRQVGESKLSRQDIWEFFITLAALARRRPQS